MLMEILNIVVKINRGAEGCRNRSKKRGNFRAMQVQLLKNMAVTILVTLEYFVYLKELSYLANFFYEVEGRRSI